MSHLITRRRSVTNAPPTLSASTTPCVSAPLNGEPTPFIEATPTASQVHVSSTSSVSVHPLSAQRPHRRRRELDPSDHTSSASRVKGEASQLAQQLSIVVSSYGVVIKQNCPMQWEKWAEIPDRTKDLVRDKLSVSILIFSLYNEVVC
ncbi:hypothetical protein DVH24_023670 [Malus domestica]|uniref:Uncharacterized protein n=1 Tax=Malus domestica TaxID=3750 RepID=A0A498I1C2_MALDO|nr:hypothetical protein DVH24_023670 [Malus domestica]